MARYSHEFMGIEGEPHEVRGMDPNFRGGYGGMRMRGDERQGAYGWHRWTHDEDFQGSGGFLGRYDQSLRFRGQSGDRRPRESYDRDWGEGGVRDLRRDPRALRDFNANSPSLRYGGEYRRSRYDRELAHRDRPRREPEPRHYQGERFDYANRGMSSGGYGEGWAWGPMRGAR